MEKLCVAPTPKNPTLEEVLGRFETWRKGKKPGNRIPKCLWRAAVEACDIYSICEVSKTLGLNYNKLKRRWAAAKHKAEVEPPSPTRFVELPLPAPPATCVVELSHASGASMKMTFQGQGPHLDAVAMMRAFWSQSS